MLREGSCGYLNVTGSEAIRNEWSVGFRKNRTPEWLKYSGEAQVRALRRFQRF
jgi:hypothetical protein